MKLKPAQVVIIFDCNELYGFLTFRSIYRVLRYG